MLVTHKLEEKSMFSVCFIQEKEGECDVKREYRLFEFRGIVCRH